MGSKKHGALEGFRLDKNCKICLVYLVSQKIEEFRQGAHMYQYAKEDFAKELAERIYESSNKLLNVILIVSNDKNPAIANKITTNPYHYSIILWTMLANLVDRYAFVNLTGPNRTTLMDLVAYNLTLKLTKNKPNETVEFYEKVNNSFLAKLNKNNSYFEKYKQIDTENAEEVQNTLLFFFGVLLSSELEEDSNSINDFYQIFRRTHDEMNLGFIFQREVSWI